MLLVTLPIRAAAMVVVAPESLDPPLELPEPPPEEPPLEPPESPVGAPESGWADEELLLQANSGEAAIEATTRQVVRSEEDGMAAPT
jgi:hypothetical protein